MKGLYTYVFFIFFTNLLFAQNRPVQMIPQPPNAYSLGKYGDIPVSLYTGVPNISIPIFTMKNRDVSVDVSLSYHGSGNKVDEIASFVGLGWSLNAGGVITRVVRGKPESLTSNGSLLPQRSDIQFYDYVQHPSTSDFIYQNKLYAASTGQLDNEPDLFYFNFMGRTGKFVFDKNGIPILESKAALDIKWQYVNTIVQKFVIKDEKGYVYEFTDYEDTFFPDDGLSRPSAWYLNKVTSPTGSSILFEYYNASSSNQVTRSYSTSIVTVLPYNTSITPPVNVPYEGTGFSELRLHKIISESGQIELIYKSERRKDYPILQVTNPASSALEQIKVYNADANLLKSFKFNTSYFEANNMEKYDGSSPEIYSYLNYRLRLDGLQEYASDMSEPLSPYTFTYLGDNNPLTDDIYTLPYRLSPAQDHWGYYNQSYNTHMIPGSSVTRSIYFPAWFKQLSPPDGPETITTAITGGANREPNAEALKAGLLSQIRYPTGGYTDFYFEANDFINYIPGARIKKIVSNPVIGLPTEKSYSYSGYSHYNPMDFYFEAYQVSYFYGDVSPGTHVLQQFGIPVEQFSGVDNRKYIKIIVQPQAILGHGSDVGYNTVTETESGKGSVTSVFSSQDRYHDYVDRDYLEEYSVGELNLLDQLFYSEYVDSWYSPGTPYGNVSTRTMSSREWPYPEIYSNSWKRGMLTDRYTRTQGNTLLKEEHFDYYHQLLQAIPAFKVIRIDHADGEYIYSKYYVPHTWSKPKSVETKEYDQNGLNPHTSITTYYYDNLDHMNPTRIENTRSDGKLEVTNITYPLDYSISETFINNMNANHLVDYPIEQVSYLVDGSDKKIVSGSITKYLEGGKGLKAEEMALEISAPLPSANFKFSNRSVGIIPPLSISSNFTPDQKYKPKIFYKNYDNKSNLSEYAPDKGMPVSYIWGYNFQYPVAEIKNASSNQCFHTSFEESGTQGAGHTGTHYYTGDYAVSWPVPDGKSYEISYWYRLSGVWMYSGRQPYSNPIILTAGDAIDDVSVYPADAQMTTYTYAPLIGMTSQTDAKGMTTYYEYDNFSRLKLIRDKDKNIVKSFQYQYAGSSADDGYPVEMQTFANTKTIGYPVGVFNINGDWIGNATSDNDYVDKWNDNAANTAICSLAVSSTPRVFNIIELKPGKTPPKSVTGLRYYQFDLPYDKIDAVRASNAEYIDFGDGTGMRMGKDNLDRSMTRPPNTDFAPGIASAYIIHTYPDATLKTLTFYHNDDNKDLIFDNAASPATSLTKIQNVRGNLPLNTSRWGGNCSQGPGSLSISNFPNWSSIRNLTGFQLVTGDREHECTTLDVPQDFLKDNPHLQYIILDWGGAYDIGINDPTFTIARLKSDWTSFFKELNRLQVSVLHLGNADLSELKNLKFINVTAVSRNHSNNPANNPIIPIPVSKIDQIIKQVAAGAGQKIWNGTISFGSGGTRPSADSKAEYDFLVSRGWNFIFF